MRWSFKDYYYLRNLSQINIMCDGTYNNVYAVDPNSVMLSYCFEWAQHLLEKQTV